MRYAFWNNKGGTGKTSLAFQAICRYAERDNKKKILAIDVCPQANLSELFLGGLTGHGGQELLKRQGEVPRCSIGGYFQARLPSPYTAPPFDPRDFITAPSKLNSRIPANIDLVCGDPLLELQANAINTLSNTQIPGANTWLEVIDWLNDFLAPIDKDYDTVFLDCNPSFSIYTQIGLALSFPSWRTTPQDGQCKTLFPWYTAFDCHRQFTQPMPSTRSFTKRGGNCRKST
jgi:cellulose biosynthesis protein BcsQ